MGRRAPFQGRAPPAKVPTAAQAKPQTPRPRRQLGKAYNGLTAPAPVQQRCAGNARRGTGSKRPVLGEPRLAELPREGSPASASSDGKRKRRRHRAPSSEKSAPPQRSSDSDDRDEEEQLAAKSGGEDDKGQNEPPDGEASGDDCSKSDEHSNSGREQESCPSCDWGDDEADPKEELPVDATGRQAKEANDLPPNGVAEAPALAEPKEGAGSQEELGKPETALPGKEQAPSAVLGASNLTSPPAASAGSTGPPSGGAAPAMIDVTLSFGDRKKKVRHMGSTRIGEFVSLQRPTQVPQQQEVFIVDSTGTEIGEDIPLSVLAASRPVADGPLELGMRLRRTDDW